MASSEDSELDLKALDGVRARVGEHLKQASPSADDVVRALAAESSPEEIAAVLAKPLAAEVVIPVLPVKPA